MRNNRATTLETSFVKEHNLSTAPPPKDSLFWKMWEASLSIAEQALHTDFIQGIKSGTLDPVEYGGFNVSDAYYCFNGAEDYLVAEKKATDKALKAFLLKKYISYQNYNQTFPKIWHLKNSEGIVPSKVCKEYSQFESKVAATQDPIYTLIVMIPCEYLWAWLGAQLSPPTSGNLYASWITGNNDPHGAYAMGNFLEAYQKNHTIDEGLAIELYKQAITFEYENFNTALKK